LPETPHQNSEATPTGVAGASRFVRACLGLPTDRTPVWFLRQAGRYMPEYMAVRKHHSLLDICRTPDIAAEVTITAAERLGVDAAIIFADLLLPLTPLGLDFEFINGEGPLVHHPIRTLEQIQALRTNRTGDLRYVSQAIEKVAKHFAAPGGDQDTLGIIGFIGAPFTLASYMIEGGSSRNYIEAKRLMYASGLPSPSPIHPQIRHPERSPEVSSRGAVEGPRRTTPDPQRSPPSATDSTAWPLLMSKLVEVLAAYAAQQVEAGADVIQVFDSWAGALSVADYRQYCLAPTTELIQRIKSLGVPVIYFGVDTASLLPTFRETGADVLGLDWRIPLDIARKTLGPRIAVQGNLDPITLFAPPEVIEARVREILTLNHNRPGHIFNLGHGIVPGTPVEAVIQVVQQIKRTVLPGVAP
jgi:uroporphyrinogen decarboxylase